MKSGPKLQSGARYASGRLKPPETRHETAPALERRMQIVAEDSKWGSVLGLMYLNEQITALEMRAGFAYAKLRGAHDGAMGYPRRSTQAMVFGEARKGAGDGLKPEAMQALRDRHADLLETIGPGRALLDRACVDDVEVRPADINLLRVRLQGVMQFFHMPQV